MSKVEKLIAREGEASEAHRDAPIPKGARVTRPNQRRSTVYSVRLNPEEVAEVQALADAAQLPTSTLVRSWIIERVRLESGEISDAESELSAAQLHLAHLKRHLSRPPKIASRIRRQQ